MTEATRPDAATSEPPAAPAVSIGMPVYNGGPHLEQALRSILAQDFPDFELIVSDNASTDGTEALCRAFAAADPRIRYFRQDANIGALPNFLFVWEKARAPLFRWAAHDDWLDADWLGTMVRHVRRTGAIAFGHLQMVTWDGAPMKHHANGHPIRFTGPVWWRRFVYATEPGYLGKANPIYGLFPREALRAEALHAFMTFGAPGDVMMLHECLATRAIDCAGPSRLYKRDRPPVPRSATPPVRTTLAEATMYEQFAGAGSRLERLAFRLAWPITALRFAWTRRLKRRRRT
ncbi:glycosyltransferase family 2 protein [Siculibacillus lacustris]|uniref:Glycosyltransferase family 2 protein n=1 Tax=Siculibacillus lacustris TaxID=1549641 RepID=A0A4Q9VQY9_9HYPH|nr:glycosyltransferase family 2 protein [Siculibacillus lacustris]TBW38269.1 glycosyltransferase family 2 protein [Siculibacillus lacustris]